MGPDRACWVTIPHIKMAGQACSTGCFSKRFAWIRPEWAAGLVGLNQALKLWRWNTSGFCKSHHCGTMTWCGTLMVGWQGGYNSGVLWWWQEDKWTNGVKGVNINNYNLPPETCFTSCNFGDYIFRITLLILCLCWSLLQVTENSAVYLNKYCM